MTDFDLPLYSPGATFLIVFGVMLLRYFALSGLAFYLSKTVSHKEITPGEISPVQIRHDVFWSVVSTVIFAGAATALIELWKLGAVRIYRDPLEYGILYLLTSLFILMFIHDSYFYWTHRLLHLKVFYRWFHRVHHGSRIPTAWTAFSFHPVEALVQALILPLLLLWFPVHWLILVIFLFLMTVLGIINHLGRELYPESFRSRCPTSFLISATHHQLHHERVNMNFGLYFNWWDTWMGSEAKRIKYGND